MAYARALGFVACTAVLLAGCASFKPAPISPANNARALDSRSLTQPRLQKFIALALAREGRPDPPARWDLATLTLAALYYHPDIEIAQARLGAARAAVVTARQRQNPRLDFSAALDRAAVAGAVPPSVVPLTIGPIVDFVIETFGKREKRTARARHLAAAARWDLASAGWLVRGRVRAALLQMWAARGRLALTQQRLKLQRELVGLLERRFAVGQASSLDVSRERIRETRIVLAVRDLQRRAADARAMLAAAIGVPLRALDGVDVSLTDFDRLPPIMANIGTGPLRRRALTKRTDVQASLEQYEAAQSALQLAVADQYPNVTLGPGYNYDLGVNKYILGLGTDLPVFQQNQGQIAQALANRRLKAAEFTALQARIIGAIDRSATAYEMTTRSLQTADRLLGDDERRARQVDSAFRAGEVSRPTLVTAELEVAATEGSRFAAVVQQREALGALEDALQEPLFDPSGWPVVVPHDARLADRHPT